MGIMEKGAGFRVQGLRVQGLGISVQCLGGPTTL